MISPPLSPDNWFSLLTRLGGALLIGGCVGWVRQTAGKAAGLRTHMLVTLTAALLVLMPLQLHTPPADEPVSYVLQGITTGIGFLGAGMILRQQPDRGCRRLKVQGLTSASEIWVSAALGASAACGLWVIAIAGTLLMLFILTVVKRLEPYIPVKVEDEC
jgi:putative Mg2+ transporter-C (MgtC) family protein